MCTVIQRSEKNPLLTKDTIPYESELVFNAGVVKCNGSYVMIFRSDYGQNLCYTDLGIATSDDGINWIVSEKPFVAINDVRNHEIIRIYDPRLTVIEGELYMCFAVDTKHGIRGGIGKISKDLTDFQIISMSLPDNRNMVLFPERIGGMYVRLERPMPVYAFGRDKFDIWISKSPDLLYWGESELLLGVENVPFANDKIGPAAPPIKTDKGWLTLFHAVDIDKSRGKNGWEDTWQKRYTVGLMLLDLHEPSKILGLLQEPLFIPEASYEISGGFRNNVIFPGGMILEDNGEVKIYYGAADTVECLATANVDDMISLLC